MKKKLLALVLCLTMSGVMLAGCGDDEEKAAEAAPAQEAEAEEEVEEEAEEEVEEEAEETADTGTMFSTLQDNYASLVDYYNQVEAFYNDDSVEQSDDVESILTQTKEVIDEMGELTEDQFETEDDITMMNDQIVSLLDSLIATVDLMQPVGASSDVDTLKATFPVGYAGVADDGSTTMWALSDNTEYGIFMILNEDLTDAISLVGPVINNGDGTVTLQDTDSGNELTLGVAEDVDEEGTPVIVITANEESLNLYEVPGADIIDALMKLQQ